MSIATTRVLKWALSIVAVVVSTLLVVTLENSRLHQMSQPGGESRLSYRLQMSLPADAGKHLLRYESMPSRPLSEAT